MTLAVWLALTRSLEKTWVNRSFCNLVPTNWACCSPKSDSEISVWPEKMRAVWQNMNLIQHRHSQSSLHYNNDNLGRVKRICVFEHSVMTNFNCACPAIQRGQASGFLSEGSSWLTVVWVSNGGSGETARMRRLTWTFAARIGDKYQICLTRPIWC